MARLMFAKIENKWPLRLAGLTSFLVFVWLLLDVYLQMSPPHVFLSRIYQILTQSLTGIFFILALILWNERHTLTIKPFFVALGLIILMSMQTFSNIYHQHLVLGSLITSLHFPFLLINLLLIWWIYLLSHPAQYPLHFTINNTLRISAWVALAIIFIRMNLLNVLPLQWITLGCLLSWGIYLIRQRHFFEIGLLLLFLFSLSALLLFGQTKGLHSPVFFILYQGLDALILLITFTLLIKLYRTSQYL